MTVPTLLTMKQYSAIQERREVINRVIHFVDGQQPPLPPELGDLTYDGGWEFRWTDTFEALRASLFEGLAICFPLAFAVLLLSTENLLVSLYAIFGIALIVASVLGTIEYISSGTWSHRVAHGQFGDRLFRGLHDPPRPHVCCCR